MTDQEAAALGAVALAQVKPGDVVGLGTGQAATGFIRALGAAVRSGLSVTGVPTSEVSATLARSLGIPLVPEPVDPGIARPDRAVSSVDHGTDTGPKGEWRNDIWYQGSGRVGEKAVERIQVYPPTRGLQTQGDPWEPVKIGILVDMELGQLLADWIDPTILAIEDAMNEGVYQRGPVEIVTVDARGLPRENYLKVQKGYRKLVDDGCVVVLGPMISDNP